MSILADLLSSLFERRYRGSDTTELDDRPLLTLADELVGTQGEQSGIALARQILERYAALDTDGRRAFFQDLLHAMSIDPDAVRQALDRFEELPDKSRYGTFVRAAEPRRQELIRRLNQVPGATGQLVAMRRDLLDLLRDDADFGPVDIDFIHLFQSWFNRGFLVLRPINWQSPAHILEKIIAYEAVHAIDSWDDLRRRVAPPDRRCFAFFHPAMPDEPLIFVEVALTRGIAGSVQALLADDREILAPEDADTAIFYSISNCQAGLEGISFGNSLIKQVVADLTTEFDNLTTFSTLSPIPLLKRWLAANALPTPDGDDEAARERWQQLAAYYLLNARRDNGMPYDPVARFHLGNGALVHAVHADADTSPKGRDQSGATMVNYLYDPDMIARNHEGFATARQIAASAEVEALASALADTLAAAIDDANPVSRTTVSRTTVSRTTDSRTTVSPTTDDQAPVSRTTDSGSTETRHG